MSGATVVTILVRFLHFAHEAADAWCVRRSARPLLKRAKRFSQNSGAARCEIAKPYPEEYRCLKFKAETRKPRYFAQPDV